MNGPPGEQLEHVGRPRSTQRTEELLALALDLAYSGGVANVTVEKLASSTGIAKTTIYRRWPNAAAIVMDAFLAEIHPYIAYQRKQSVRLTFESALTRLVRALQGRRGELLRQLLGAAQHDPELAAAFWERWIRPRRAAALEVLQEGVDAGEIRNNLDLAAAVDVLFGAVYYRLLIPYAPLTASYAKQVVSTVFDGPAQR